MGILCLFVDSKEKKHKMLEEEACLRYQVKEYDGELWLTFNGSLVCPCVMMKDMPVDAVKKMRELYIKRHEK